MAGSLTAATAVITFSIPGVYDVAQQLQQFAADDIFSTESLQSAEVQMGVDGTLSGGFVFVPVKQKYMLQANSPSVKIFDDWWSASQTALDVFSCLGNITLKSINSKWNLVNGFLTSYSPMPDAGKLLKPRSFEITWQQMLPQPSL